MGWELWPTVEHLSDLREWPPFRPIVIVRWKHRHRVARASALAIEFGLWGVVCDLGSDLVLALHSQET